MRSDAVRPYAFTLLVVTSETPVSTAKIVNPRDGGELVVGSALSSTPPPPSRYSYLGSRAPAIRYRSYEGSLKKCCSPPTSHSTRIANWHDEAIHPPRPPLPRDIQADGAVGQQGLDRHDRAAHGTAVN